jgi:hypothetical protein
MTRIFLFSMLFGFLLGYTVRARASEPTNLLTAALSYGPSSVSDSAAPGLETKGNFREVLAMMNRSTARWNFGAGIGFFASDLTGTSHATSGSGLALSSYTRSVAGEAARLAAHYRLTDHLEAGLTADLLFGSDVSFSSSLFDTSSTAWLAGTEILYGFGRNVDLLGFEFKAGLRYFASVSLAERRLDAFQAVLEAGLPL